MVAEIVTFKVAPGKTAQALKWVAKSAAYVKKASPGWQLSVLQPISGGGDSEVVLVNRMPSLSEFEDQMNHRRDDPAWQAIAKEGQGSDWWLGFTRQIYRVVD